MRKYKQVKRKEIVFDLNEWKAIEEKAASVSLPTGKYIKRMVLDGQINYYDMGDVSRVLSAMRIIGGNINQIAKKANETNSIYAGDIEILRKEHLELCRSLSQFLSEIPSTKVLPTS